MRLVYIGLRYEQKCKNLVTVGCPELTFYRSTNTIFGKIGRIASEEVTVGLINCKCMPILLYGLECFSVAKNGVKSLDFAVTRFLMKLFRSTNINVIDECWLFFNFTLPSEKMKKRRVSVKSKGLNCNSLLYYFNIRVCIHNLFS